MQIPGNAKKIIEVLQQNSHDAYVVGGCVRDTLMGQVPGDWDITTSAKPGEVKALFRRTIDTGIEHGTVTILMPNHKNVSAAYAGSDPKSRNESIASDHSDQKPFESYEVTTYRVDGDYSDHRRPDKVEFSTDLSEDLKRRDFTINAMAYNDRAGLVDEFDGQGDLDRKIVRCVGNPDHRFDEDALRMLRAIRFAAKLKFNIDEDTYNAIEKHAPVLSNVSAERIYAELYKTITSDAPQKLQMLWDLGLADYVSEHFSWIEGARGVLTGNDSSKLSDTEAAHVHLNFAPWAALMRNITADEAKTILRELKADNDTIRNTCLLVDEYHRPLPVSDYEIKKSLNRIGRELFSDLLLLKADEYSMEQLDAVRIKECKCIAKNEPYLLGQLKINGNDILALGYKGREVGEKLEELLDKVMQDPSINTHEELEKMAEGKLNE